MPQQTSQSKNLRKSFFQKLEKLMEKDEKIILLYIDLGFSFVEKLIKRFPDRCINTGIIEQAAIGVAAGLALQGFKPYCYSAIPFLLMRTYEFIRDDVAYANLNVKLIGYTQTGFLGFTHNLEGKENEEDLLKNLPNIKRYYPKTEKELGKALKNNKPSFIKI